MIYYSLMIKENLYRDAGAKFYSLIGSYYL